VGRNGKEERKVAARVYLDNLKPNCNGVAKWHEKTTKLDTRAKDSGSVLSTGSRFDFFDNERAGLRQVPEEWARRKKQEVDKNQQRKCGKA